MPARVTCLTVATAVPCTGCAKAGSCASHGAEFEWPGELVAAPDDSDDLNLTMTGEGMDAGTQSELSAMDVVPTRPPFTA